MNVLGYVKGLQDWQSGGHEWHMRSSRYMNASAGAPPAANEFCAAPAGLGTSAAAHQNVTGKAGSRQVQRATRTPRIRQWDPWRCPSSTCRSVPGTIPTWMPRAAIAWNGPAGWECLTHFPAAPASASGTSTNSRGFDFANCAAMIHPDASGPELDLSSGWLTWGTYADDYFPIVFGHTRDMAGAKAFNERLPAFMPVNSAASPVPVNPVERGLADLWSRTVSAVPENARRQFRGSVLDMAGSWLWELANQIKNRIPDPVDYIEMRRKTFGSDLTMSLSRLSHGQEIPPGIYRTRPMRGLDNSAADFACLANDIFSYQKEIQFEGELNNGVLVVQNFLGCDLRRAVNVVNDLMTSRMRQFERIVATELPALFDESGLDMRTRAILNGYAEELQNWMAGVLEWHRTTRRYHESELRYPATAPRIRSPDWAGYVSARIAELFDALGTAIAPRQ